jgi:hypothetical protein
MERRARGVPNILMELQGLSTDQLLDRYAGLLDALRTGVSDDLDGLGGEDGDDGRPGE